MKKNKKRKQKFKTNEKPDMSCPQLWYQPCLFPGSGRLRLITPGRRKSLWSPDCVDSGFKCYGTTENRACCWDSGHGSMKQKLTKMQQYDKESWFPKAQFVGNL